MINVAFGIAFHFTVIRVTKRLSPLLSLKAEIRFNYGICTCVGVYPENNIYMGKKCMYINIYTFIYGLVKL